MFNALKPKLAIYSHVVMYGGEKPKDIMNRARKSYAGPLLVGHDLMTINVGADKVSVAK